jgi:tRNA (guanine37-N1)-methyltransferase
VTLRIDVISIFPEYFAPLRLSLIGRAADHGIIDLRLHQLRDWAHDAHRSVDDTPAGGGPGMVMTPGPWGEALDAVVGDAADAAGADRRSTIVFTTPAGRVFTQRTAEALARTGHLVICCGRFEGIDQRVVDYAAALGDVMELSIGDYVLAGGEAAALVMVEAVGRLLPGVLGNPESLVEESHNRGLLEHPAYTKPAVWRGRAVPEVLLGGDHAAVDVWRAQQSRERTRRNRPDLLADGDLRAVDDRAVDDAEPPARP